MAASPPAPRPCSSRPPRIFLAVTLADLVNEIAETFVTGRTAQRVMLSLRIRIWAQLQRLSLDYYEGEMAGRIMTRMTTDVDQFESLIENGLLSALVSIVTFAGVGIALVVINPELGLLVMTLAVPMAVVTVLFRRRAAVLYDLSRERIAILNADFQESLSGVREAQAFSHEAETIRRFHQLGRNYLETRIAAQRLVGAVLPVHLSVRGRLRGRHRARRGRRPGGLGPALNRRAHRLHPLHRHVLLADPAALAGVRFLAADQGVGRPHRRPDGRSRP